MGKKFYYNEIQTSGRLYQTYGLYGGAPYSEIEYMNSPITPKENYLRFMRGEDYYWIPDTYSDFYELSPNTIPDYVAMGYEGGYDSFGVYWEPLENGLPALVRPGNPLLKDINDWREAVKIPDPNDWDWVSEAEKYNRIIDRTRMVRANVPTLLFERLIDLLEFENAAACLLTDPEETGALLDAITEYNIKIIDNYYKYYQPDAVLLSDDWSSQMSPFFSEKVAREIFLPRMKRMVSHCHELGLYVCHHSCGNGVKHIPVMIDAGVDIWQFQENAVDFHKAIKDGGDKLVLEGYWVMPETMDTEEKQTCYIQRIIEDYGMKGRVTVAFCDADYLVSPYIRKKVYELGRRAADKMNHHEE